MSFPDVCSGYLTKKGVIKKTPKEMFLKTPENSRKSDVNHLSGTVCKNKILCWVGENVDREKLREVAGNNLNISHLFIFRHISNFLNLLSIVEIRQEVKNHYVLKMLDSV